MNEFAETITELWREPETGGSEMQGEVKAKAMELLGSWRCRPGPRMEGGRILL
ncbi:MAG: hypothetical protein ACLU9S_12155 [Oscillospiraceae bacterium]